MVRPILKRTTYKLFKRRKSIISYFYNFSCKCFVLNNRKDNLWKFDAKNDKGDFLDYSTSSKAYRIFNKRILVVEKFIYIIFYDSKMILDVKIYQKNQNDAWQRE